MALRRSLHSIFRLALCHRLMVANIEGGMSEVGMALQCGMTDSCSSVEPGGGHVTQ